ncbi:MAG: tripartite tricarboxylate transporter substrate-binding protein [Candidatus Binatia bacterium]|nr:tripartite tricarboxylate transporter substrate-binding protein [Candidatus Binatia bacterium]
MKKDLLLPVYLVVGLFFIFGTSTMAFGEDFYKGRTGRIIVGSSPGGGFDTYARLFSRHLPKHIPGKPNMIVVNMPGAGGLIAANYMYNVAKPDGLTISHLLWTVPQAEFLGVPAVQYKANKFEWLGLANSSVITVAVRAGSPIQSVEDWLNPETKKLIFGCNTRATLTCSLALALNDIFGPISKIVPGFAGTALVRAAMLRKEVDALTGWTWDSVKATGFSMIEKGEIKLLAYIGENRHPALDKRKVTYLNDYVTKPDDRAFLKVLLMPATMVRPWASVPGTPKDRVRILRKAFAKTMKDPGLLKDAKRMKVDVAPKSAEWLINFINQTKRELKPEVVGRARRVLGIE